MGGLRKTHRNSLSKNRHQLAHAFGGRDSSPTSQRTNSVPHASKPAVQFCVAGVLRRLDRSNGALGSAARCKRLQAEAILVAYQVGISIPLRSVASGVSARPTRAAMDTALSPLIRCSAVSLPRPLDSPSRPSRIRAWRAEAWPTLPSS